MTINPQEVFETTWWERAGFTEWEKCGDDGKSQRRRQIYRRIGTTETMLKTDLPIGALFALDREDCKNQNDWPPAAPHDGLSICCVCIGRGGPESRHHWYIDYRASNCTLPSDKNHRCWVRHGTVGEKLTVDKAGLTCAAGAGSFYMGPNNEWHGFLRQGKLTP